MSDMARLDTVQIVSTPGVLGGKARVEGRRVSVQQIAAYYEHADWSAEEIAEAFGLTLSEVYAAISYYYAHQHEFDAEIEAERAWAEEIIAERERAASADALDAVMTAAAVAEAYDLAPRTVRDAIENGWIEARKSAGTWLIRRADAEARWGQRKGED